MPAWIAGRGADAWWEDEPRVRRQLAETVAAELERDLASATYGTGSAKFDGEWLFGTWQMAALGFSQLAGAATTDAERRRWLDRSARALEGVLRPEVRAFTAAEWGSDPIESLTDPGQHHAAYLGYLGVPLGLYRAAGGDDAELIEVHDRINASLVARMEASATLLLETYPGEVYPVDNCAVASTVALHPSSDAELLARWKADVRRRWVDPDTGFLIQAVTLTGAPHDAPRGSGTALCALFVGTWDVALADELRGAMRRQARSALGFGGVREYPRTHAGGPGDIDSGPVIAGIGVSATGFSIAAARGLDDRRWFVRLHRTSWLFGAPAESDGGRRFVTGGSLGNAIMLAMLTAPRGSR